MRVGCGCAMLRWLLMSAGVKRRELDTVNWYGTLRVGKGDDNGGFTRCSGAM